MDSRTRQTNGAHDSQVYLFLRSIYIHCSPWASLTNFRWLISSHIDHSGLFGFNLAHSASLWVLTRLPQASTQVAKHKRHAKTTCCPSSATVTRTQWNSGLECCRLVSPGALEWPLILPVWWSMCEGNVAWFNTLLSAQSRQVWRGWNLHSRDWTQASVTGTE